MEAAGAAVAQVVIARYPGRRVQVLCGPGANGGDGYVAARRLRDGGFSVDVLSLTNPATLTGDAADAFAQWGAPVATAEASAVATDAVIVDALFGAGLSRPLERDAADIAHACAGSTVVSVDVPSGVPGDGAPPSGPTFRAAITVTFVRRKPAHVLEPSASACGEIIVADIGAPPQALLELPIYAEENDPSLWRLPAPDHGAYKHKRGRVVVVADAASVSLTFGASRLAATAALRTGAGWVSVAIPNAQDSVHFSSPAALLVQRRADVTLADFNVAVIGPGAPVGGADLAPALSGQACVIDGGALGPGLRVSESSVLTPHAGEFARAFPEIPSGSKVERTRAAAAQCGGVVVFKGPDTVIAAPDGRVRVNRHASPYLASAGTGDVLAGMIAGLLAQTGDAFDAACAAVWLHGDAALRAGPGLIADDLVDGLPVVLAAGLERQR